MFDRFINCIVLFRNVSLALAAHTVITPASCLSQWCCHNIQHLRKKGTESCIFERAS